jgi:hypothetical protein
MKKTSLSSAVVAGIAGVVGLTGAVNAVNLNPDGLGQVLIYPYYTVNNNNITLLSVVNTTDQSKAVKVRFLESLNSAEVLDFNLYLSPFDVWTAAVAANGTTGASLTTSDRSCTVPSVFANQPVAFRTFEFEDNAPDILGLLGTPGEARVRQGYVEMIEMGVLLNEGTNLFNPRSASIHNNGVPSNCAILENAWAQGGAWDTARGRAVNAPSGGLFGSATIVNVAQGRAATYNADAIDGFWTSAGLANEVLATGTSTQDLHRAPGTIDPSLADARTGTDAVLGDIATARIFDNGAPVNIVYPAGQPDAVSAVLMARSIFNEYNLDTGLNAASEWVITFPTKRQHTYVLAGSDVRPFSDSADVDASGRRDGLPFDTIGLCEAISFRYWDREERTTTTGVDFSPPRQTPGLALCWEANVLAFNQTLGANTATTVLGATPALGANGVAPIIYQSGWARIEFDNPSVTGFQNYLASGVRESDRNRVAVVGLPVVGFWVADYLNTAAQPGVRAFFNGTHAHRVDRDGYLLGVGAANPAFGTSLTATGSSWTSSN